MTRLLRAILARRRMAAPVRCDRCGLRDPGPEMNCQLGNTLLYHHAGFTDGCPACGRLEAACWKAPCVWRRGQLVRAETASLEGP